MSSSLSHASPALFPLLAAPLARRPRWAPMVGREELLSVLDALARYRSARQLTSWEETLADLLPAGVTAP